MNTDADPSTADTATLLTGRIAFGDQGTGSMPLDGELALTSAGRPPWQSTLSTNALQAAEGLWARRQNARTLSDEEATAITRVAFDVDLAFLGLAANWGTARLTPITGGAEPSGFHGGSQSTEDEGHGCTEEVPGRAA